MRRIIIELMKNDLTEFGYIGDLSDLILDIFTGCMFSEQNERKTILLNRGIEWNKFLDGDSVKWPDSSAHSLFPTIDQYLIKEYSKYITAWLENGNPAMSGDFTKAKNILDTYFKHGHCLSDLNFYKEREWLPTCGRQAFIFQVALNWLAQNKGKPCNGKFAREFKQYAEMIHKSKAASAHSHGRDDLGFSH